MGTKFNGGKGGVICDKCRVLIIDGYIWNRELIECKTKSGDILHFCSFKCKNKHLGVNDDREYRHFTSPTKSRVHR